MWYVEDAIYNWNQRMLDDYEDRTFDNRKIKQVERDDFDDEKDPDIGDRLC